MQLSLDLRKFGVTKVIDVTAITSIDTSKTDKNILTIGIEGRQIDIKFPNAQELIWIFDMITFGQVKFSDR